MVARKSLRERNKAAIAHDPNVEAPRAEEGGGVPAAAATTPAGPEPSATGRPARPRAAAAVAGIDAAARIGIYLTHEQFEAAKAGYLADWNNGGHADSFARWVAAAMDTYAALSVDARAEATPRGRSAARTGATRSFSIPTDSVGRMRAAITADQRSGRWPSDSAWCAEAIERATAAAKARNGGVLPDPPARLPNRLTR